MVPFKIRNFTFIDNRGHGWLQVPYQDVVDAGIESDISELSYRNQAHAFLEQYGDAPRFIDVLKKRHIQFKITVTEVQDFVKFLQSLPHITVRFNKLR